MTCKNNCSGCSCVEGSWVDPFHNEETPSAQPSILDGLTPEALADVGNSIFKGKANPSAAGAFINPSVTNIAEKAVREYELKRQQLLEENNNSSDTFSGRKN